MSRDDRLFVFVRFEAEVVEDFFLLGRGKLVEEEEEFFLVFGSGRNGGEQAGTAEDQLRGQLEGVRQGGQGLRGGGALVVLYLVYYGAVEVSDPGKFRLCQFSLFSFLLQPKSKFVYHRKHFPRYHVYCEHQVCFLLLTSDSRCLIMFLMRNKRFLTDYRRHDARIIFPSERRG